MILKRDEIDINFINQLIGGDSVLELYLEENDKEAGVPELRTLLVETHVESAIIDDEVMQKKAIWWNSEKWDELDIEIDYNEGKLESEERTCHECGRLLAAGEGFQTQTDGVVCDWCREAYDEEGRFLW